MYLVSFLWSTPCRLLDSLASCLRAAWVNGTRRCAERHGACWLLVSGRTPRLSKTPQQSHAPRTRHPIRGPQFWLLLSCHVLARLAKHIQARLSEEKRILLDIIRRLAFVAVLSPKAPSIDPIIPSSPALS